MIFTKIAIIALITAIIINTIYTYFLIAEHFKDKSLTKYIILNLWATKSGVGIDKGYRSLDFPIEEEKKEWFFEAREKYMKRNGIFMLIWFFSWGFNDVF